MPEDRETYETVDEVFVWERVDLRPKSFRSAEERSDEALARWALKTHTLLVPDAPMVLAQDANIGKVSDCGYDQMVCCATQIPADSDFTFSARIKLIRWCEDGRVNTQSGFGIFARDTLEPEPATGFLYANMVAVGGFRGRTNVLVRHGVTSESLEDITTAVLHEELAATSTLQTTPDSPRDLFFELSKKGNLMSARFVDAAGNDLLGPADRRFRSDARKRGFTVHRDGTVTFAILENMFCKRDGEQMTIGFFVARGAELEVDRESVHLNVQRPDGKRNHPTRRVVPRPTAYPELRATPSKTTCHIRKKTHAGPLFAAPLGSHNPDGSREHPFSLEEALAAPGSGDILLLQGTYRPSASVILLPRCGGNGERYRRFAAVNEEAGSVVFDFKDTQSGLFVAGDYWEISGVAVTRGLGIHIIGSHNRILNCTAAFNHETGILIRHPDNSSPRSSWPAMNSVEGCVSFGNADTGEDGADGFACKVCAGEGNRFVGCIAFANADDGFDLFTKNRAIGAVELISCESYLNGYVLEGNVLRKSHGNGCGFKLGGSGLAVPHVAENCIAKGNRHVGFSSNSNPLLSLIRCAGANNAENLVFTFTSIIMEPKLTIEDCSFEDDPTFDAANCLAELQARFRDSSASLRNS